MASEEHNWYHTIELPDGTITSGYGDPRRARAYVTWPGSLKGGRCLDVGTFDGFWAFEMERQGAAEVIGLDIDDPEAFDWFFDSRQSGPAMLREQRVLEGRGFSIAANALGSAAKRVCASVYELDPEVHGRFDVVNCGQLLLHLRDPVLALERMRGVCDGELVLIENLDSSLEVRGRRIPCARFAPEHDKWWRANSAGIVHMIDRAGFELTWVGKRFVLPHGPKWAGTRPPLIHSIVAGDLRHRGGLHRVFRARPRPPSDV